MYICDCLLRVQVNMTVLADFLQVVVAVTGGGLSFEGRNKEKSLAEQEAAEKMLKALEVFPGCSLADALRQPENHNPEKPGSYKYNNNIMYDYV